MSFPETEPLPVSKVPVALTLPTPRKLSLENEACLTPASRSRKATNLSKPLDNDSLHLQNSEGDLLKTDIIPGVVYGETQTSDVATPSSKNQNFLETNGKDSRPGPEIENTEDQFPTTSRSGHRAKGTLKRAHFSRVGVQAFFKTEVETDRSCWVFSRDGRVRRACTWVVQHPRFDFLLVRVIILNCVQMVLFLEEVSLWGLVTYLEYTFTLIYTLEFLLKALSKGLVFGKGAYFHSLANCADFSMLVPSWIEVGFALFHFDVFIGSWAWMRVHRILRAFRALHMFPGLQVLVVSLFSALPHMMRIATLALLLVLIFALAGLQVFMGVLRSQCVPWDAAKDEPIIGDEWNDGDLQDHLSYISCSACPEHTVCKHRDNPYFGQLSFDSFSYSMLTVFVILTGEGWTDMLYRVSRKTSLLSLFYFLPVVLVGTNFIMNLMLASFKGAFSSMVTKELRRRRVVRGQHLYNLARGADLEDTRWERFQKSVSSILCSPVSACLRACHLGAWLLDSLLRFVKQCQMIKMRVQFNLLAFIDTSYFENTIMLATFANSVLMAMYNHKMTEETMSHVELAGLVLLAIFLAESLIKLAAKGLAFWLDGYDVFELVMNVMALGEYLLMSSSSMLLLRALHMRRMLRSVRVLRMFKLSRYMHSLQLATKVAVSTFHSMGNVILLLVVAVFAFAIMGMSLFRQLYQNAHASQQELLAPRSHFMDFAHSCLTIFQALDGEGWTLLMYDVMSFEPMAALFYVLWQLLGTYILLALLMGVVLDNFERDYTMKKKESKMNQKTSAAPGLSASDEDLDGEANGRGTHLRMSNIPDMLEILGERATQDSLDLIHLRLGVDENHPDDSEFHMDVVITALKGVISEESMRDLSAFYSLWIMFDLDNSGYLTLDQIKEVLAAMGEDMDPLVKMTIEDTIVQKAGEAARNAMMVLSMTKDEKSKTDRSKSIKMQPQSTENTKTSNELGFVSKEDVQVSFLLFIEQLITTRQPGVSSNQLVDDLGLEHVDGLRVSFGNYDKDRSGFIDSSEFGEFLNNLMPGITTWEVESLIREIDEDSSGSISFSEFLRGTHRLLSKGELEGVATGADGASVRDPNQDGSATDEVRSKSSSNKQAIWMKSALLASAESKKLLAQRSSDIACEVVMETTTPGRSAAYTAPKGDQHRHLPKDETNGTAVIARATSPMPDNIGNYLMDQVGLGNNSQVTWNGSGSYVLRSLGRYVRAQLLSLLEPESHGEEDNEEEDEEAAAAALAKSEETGGGGGGGRNLRRILTHHPGRFLKIVVRSKIFERTVLAMIAASCVALAMEDPRADSHTSFQEGLDTFFTLFFLMELVLKCAVLGLSAYLANSWNVLDLVVVLPSSVGLAVVWAGGSGLDLQFLKTIRILRVLRPLRAISHRPRLRHALNTIILALPPLASVGVIVLFVLLIFSIIATSLFTNQFHRCAAGGHYFAPLRHSQDADNNAPALWNITDCYEQDRIGGVPAERYKWVNEEWACWDIMANLSTVETDPYSHWVPLHYPDDLNTKSKCEAAGYRWVDSILNFNNVARSSFTLFVIVTGEGWVEIMWQACDIPFQSHDHEDESKLAFPPNESVEYEAQLYNALFFVFFLVLLSFFLMDMFAGAVVTYYMMQKRTVMDEDNLTVYQRKWRRTNEMLQKKLSAIRPPSQVTSASTRKRLQRFVDSPVFITIVTASVFIQVCLLCTQHYGQPELLTTVISGFNVVCFLLMTVEIALRLLAVGSLVGYLQSAWNRFDALLFLVNLLEFFLSWVVNMPSFGLAGTTCLRMLRIGRFLHDTPRVLYDSKPHSILSQFFSLVLKLQTLLDTFLVSLASLVDIGVLMVLFLFVFAVLGMNLFGSLGSNGQFLNSDANFTSFGRSVLTLIRVMYGEDWQALFEDIVWMSCDAETRVWNPEDCDISVPALYFVCHYFAIVLMIMNLFLAVMVDTFETMTEQHSGATGDVHINRWIALWLQRAEFDTVGPWLDLKGVCGLLRDVPEPLGLGIRQEEDLDDNSNSNPGNSRKTIKVDEDPTLNSEILKRLWQLQLNFVHGRVYLEEALTLAVMRVKLMTHPGAVNGNNSTLKRSLLTDSYASHFFSSKSDLTRSDLASAKPQT